MKAEPMNLLAETEEQNIYILFDDYLSSMYYPGYADQLANENPDAFQFELAQFIFNNF